MQWRFITMLRKKLFAKANPSLTGISQGIRILALIFRMADVPLGLTRLAGSDGAKSSDFQKRGLEVPFFTIAGSYRSADSALLLGENRRHFRFIQMIQRSFNQQMHPVGHAAERQGYGAA